MRARFSLGRLSNGLDCCPHGSRKPLRNLQPAVGSRRTASKACAPCSCRTKRKSPSHLRDSAGTTELSPALSSRDGGPIVRDPTQKPNSNRDESLAIYARTLLRRYGVVFRRMLERESFGVPWFELLRIYRRLEAQGESRGGYFVGGVSGEQFALPEAIGLLRSVRRKHPRDGEEFQAQLITISGADPLNLVGILVPGPRIAAITSHRILLRDGKPVAALKAGQFISLEPEAIEPNRQVEQALRVGTLSPALRPYYA